MSPSSVPKARSPLGIAELLYNILDILAKPSTGSDGPGRVVQAPSPRGRAALASLAQTCRGIREPSLDYLWRRLTSLRPVFLLFNSRDNMYRTERFWCPPSPGSWAILNQYLHRVREVEVMDQQSLFVLQSTLFEKALLPNLQVLRWDPRDGSAITCVKPLICPSLSILDIASYDVDENALTSLFRTLPSRCPGLTTVSFKSASGFDDGFKESLSQAVCQFKQVKYLSVQVPIEDKALHHILLSAGLEELSFVAAAGQLEDSDLVVPSSDTCIPLQNVKKLELWLSDLNFISRYLHPGRQLLREMTIHLQKLELPLTFESFFAVLASPTQTSCLESLKIYSGDIDPRPDVSQYALNSDTLQRLSLRHLRELRLQLENAIAINDAELADIAQGWPMLETLDLCAIRLSSTEDKFLSLRGLVWLAAACPKLRAVALTLNAIDSQEPTRADIGLQEGSQFPALVEASFPNSPIGDDNTEAIGELLVSYFPSLTSDGRWRMFKWALPWDQDFDAPGWGPVWECIDRHNGCDAGSDPDSSDDDELLNDL